MQESINENGVEDQKKALFESTTDQNQPGEVPDLQDQQSEVEGTELKVPSEDELYTANMISFLKTEEDYWGNLILLKGSEDSYEKTTALHNTYVALANHYSSLGGAANAIGFLKNALALREDPDVRRRLATLEGESSGYDFINSFDILLKDQPYNLNLILEYCYFLEIHNLHDAALDILEEQLKKGAKISDDTPADIKVEIASCINDFLIILQARINVEWQLKLGDYMQVFKDYFPKAITDQIALFNVVHETTIIGKELEETEEDYGLWDEVKKYAGLLNFFSKHYKVKVVVGIIGVVLVCMAFFRVPGLILQKTGDISSIILLLILIFDIIKPLRMKEVSRYRKLTRAVNNVIFSSFTLGLLNFLGPILIFDNLSFFSPLTVKIAAALLIIALIWRTQLSMDNIKRSLVNTKEALLEALKSRTLRAQIANLVFGSARLTLYTGIFILFNIMAKASAMEALLGFAQLLFLGACCKWGYHEVNAEKQKLRDSLAYIIALIFLALTFIQYKLNSSIWFVVVTLSFDCQMFLGICAVYALQVRKLNKFWLKTIFATVITLNFVPLLKLLDKRVPFIAFPLSQYNTAIAIVNSILLVLLIIFSRRRKSQVIYQENYMGSKYQINGGQQHAVGDNALSINK